MAKNPYFKFKQFTIYQDQCAMKVSTDTCIFGAWVSVQADDRRALDIGCGTGVLSCMLAQKNKSLKIDAIDIDEAAYLQAKDNVSKSPFADQIKVHHTSLQDFRQVEKYDLIFSNPPYFENDLASPDLGTNVAKHSISLSLEDLFFYAFNLLETNGRFCIVIPQKRMEDIKVICLKLGFYISHYVEVRHRPESACNLVLLSFVKKECTLQNDTIFIYEMDGMHNEKFKALLQDYYLNF